MSAAGNAQAVEARLRAEIETLRQLLEVNEATAIAQAERAESARLETERASGLEEAQRRLVHDLISVGADAVIVLDENWVVTYMNQQAMEEVSDGQSRVGSKLLDIYPQMEMTSFWPRYRRVMEERVSISFEDLYDPRGIWYQVNAAPVGTGIGFFFRDVTDRRQRDAALQRTEKLAAVGRLASSISHEINNPLESVTNLLYLIQTAGSIDDDTRTYAQLASSELQRVSHIVTQTLKFHRQSTDATRVRASEILDSVLSLFHGRIVTLNTVLTTDYDPDDSLLCYTGDMRQVFANLIGNALDATADKKGERGRVVLRTRQGQCPVTGARGVRVTVADNGYGMSAATQRSIFDAFFTTKGATGTGLGLWVSHEIIRNHNGVVRVRSCETAGRSGTTFTVFFPETG
jgi:signal transduction histidine kinase